MKKPPPPPRFFLGFPSTLASPCRLPAPPRSTVSARRMRALAAGLPPLLPKPRGKGTGFKNVLGACRLSLADTLDGLTLTPTPATDAPTSRAAIGGTLRLLRIMRAGREERRGERGRKETDEVRERPLCGRWIVFFYGLHFHSCI